MKNNNDNVHIICPNCGTEFEYLKGNEVKVHNGPLPDGIYTLIPKNDKRLNQLKDLGIDITKFISGSSVPAASNNVSSPASDDEIVKSIKSDGYVEGKQLFRRWIMAQMFRALNYEGGYDKYYKKNYDYQYSWDTLINELAAQRKIKNNSEFYERQLFFNANVAIGMIKDYINRLKMLLKGRKRKCRGQEYVHIPYSGMYFVTEIEEAIKSANRYIILIREANDKELLNIVIEFNNHKINLEKNTSKGNNWRNAFIGAGAYYTLQNLIMFHGCKIDGNDMEKSLEILKVKAEEGWDHYPLFALMKEVIEKNHYIYGSDF